ncbi:hypothetical protein BO78DRAFT_379582 [Aspergillus sclerotiicarbonarius CBS 121057]|uniref:Uncharacterized protein n=1 Tax=Aspergillus sclerotiicarbonarius (strain CBS 121057 / IBT 28362) TaxID=1448318 RepID=A0A319E3T5_ASPSB|nr:hypothetical protein BO78DRAFT_379582 [Aspergillus sclerotiicarbonarius CBS 121057]
MSHNQIFKKAFIGTIAKNGKTIQVSVATETTHWRRPDSIAQNMKDRVFTALENHSAPLPEYTAEIIIRESEHESQNDKRTHFTGVCVGEKEEATSVHIPVPQGEKTG